MRPKTLPEFEVTINVRNNRIKKMRLALGLTQRQAARASGCSDWGCYERLAISPVSSRGQWCRTARAVADFLCAQPEELWPDSVKAVTQSKIVRELSGEDVGAYVGAGTVTMALPPSEIVEAQERAKELPKEVAKALTQLHPREVQVLTARFGLDGSPPKNLAATGAIMGLTRERIRQIEAKALHKLQWRGGALRVLHGLRMFPVHAQGVEIGTVCEDDSGWLATLAVTGPGTARMCLTPQRAERWIRAQEHARQERLARP